MKTAQTPEQVLATRLARANEALTAFRGRIQELLESGPAWLQDYAKDSWEIVEAHTEITQDNGLIIQDALIATNKTHRPVIYYGLVERGELDTGFALLHDTIHDAASLTNGIYFLSNKW